MIQAKSVSWKYKTGKTILNEVSFALDKGRITTFMGHSGAGKTTLLKCLANLHTRYEGMITWNGRDLRSLHPVERVSKIGFVPQQFYLFPHFTVLQNCTYALIETLGLTKQTAQERSLEVLELLQMVPWKHAYPSQLSGGQQQRVAIARALVLRPEILLLDEPTSALDPESKKSLETILIDLNKKGMTIALSSHDMPFIRKVMDFICFLKDGTLMETWDRAKDDLSSREMIQQFLTHQ